MARKDWLVGPDRGSEATERILDGAWDLIALHGFEALTIEKLSAAVNCSPATIYRHTGGKAAIREAVVVRASALLVAAVREAVEPLDGAERLAAAMEVGLRSLRATPLGQLMMGSIRPDQDSEWLTASPRAVKLTEELLGIHDPLAAQWFARVILALWFWPVKDSHSEREIVRRFIAPALL